MSRSRDGASFRRTPLPGVTALAMLLGLVGCSSGGPDGPGGTRPVGASFLPARPDPQTGEISASQGDATGDLVDVLISVTDVPGIFSADFRVVWNAERAELLGWTEGPLLGKDGAATSFAVDDVGTGVIRVQARRVGTGAGVTAVGTEELLRLEYRVLKTGSAPLSLPAAGGGFPRTLRDPNEFDISDLVWFGGQLLGS